MITEERKRIIEGSLHANNPEEREYLRNFIHRCGLDTWPKHTPKRRIEGDYEGAILAQAEQYQF